MFPRQFARHGRTNIKFHTQRSWAEVNSHRIIQSQTLHCFIVKCVGANTGDGLAGLSHRFQHKLEAISYRDLSHRIIPQLPVQISLQRRGCMWFMLNGVSSRFNLSIIAFLCDKNMEQFLARGGPNE